MWYAKNNKAILKGVYIMKTEKIIKIGDEKYFYTSGYYPQNKFIDNDTVVLARSEDEKIGQPGCDPDKKVEMVKVSLKYGTIEVLDDDVKTADYLVYGNYIYYNNKEGIKRYNLETNESEMIYINNYFFGENGVEENIDGEPANVSGPHITNDGKYISFYISEQKDGEKAVFFRFNTETFEVEEIFRKGFRKPFCHANHLMICPENKDLFFYAHEGETCYIPNRLWMFNYKDGSDRNIAKQRLDENGYLGDCHGHECWAHDGKGMYFCKYPNTSTINPTGICYVDAETGKHELLYTKYTYWHVCAGRDGRYITADTQYAPFQSEVVVIDTKTGEEFVVDMPPMTAVHPCHPHPQLSPDCDKVIYNALDENNRTCVKVAYIMHEC